MAVKIRLARHGRRNRPYYRMVVADGESRRDGRFLEVVGKVNTLTDPPTTAIKEERVKYWLSVGAKPSDTASQVIDKFLPGYIKGLEQSQQAKLRSRRAVRKARQKDRNQASV